MGFSLWNIFKVGSLSSLSAYVIVEDDESSLATVAIKSHPSLFLIPPSFVSHHCGPTFPSPPSSFLHPLLCHNQAGLLFINAILVLHRKRFLGRYGLDDVNNMGCDPSKRPLQTQAIGLLQAVQYLKVPVIAANMVTIVFELLLGGG